MRQSVFAIALALSMVPATAAAQGQPTNRIEVPQELTDPKVADQLGRMTQALSKAMLDLPIGEIEAAAEGRPVTPADRRRTIRDLEPDIERRVAESGPRIRSAMRAMTDALPAITEALAEAADKIERATANMPQPGYPKY